MAKSRIPQISLSHRLVEFFIILAGVVLLVLFSINIVLPYFLKTDYSTIGSRDQIASAEILEPPVAHMETPEPLKAIYMTACVAGTPSWRESLKELIKTTELNAVVIDIKDYTGTISFPNDFPKVSGSKGCVVSDMKDFVASLHADDIYVIGRISVFQDLSYTQLFPELAVKSKKTGGVWKDRKGIAFVDVGAKDYWQYILDISKASYELGFDELNFDYIRYPSDGDMKDTNFTWTVGTSTKPEMLEGFFAHLAENLKGTGAKTSADLFGMTTTITNDMGIGQVLERALPYFDYVAPMVYPSHYPATWNGFANPASHPYEVIQIAMKAGRDREVALNISNGLATSTSSKLRPWLQDFDLGGDYGPAEVRAQMKATYDVGLTSWMLWSAANKYTAGALLP